MNVGDKIVKGQAQVLQQAPITVVGAVVIPLAHFNVQTNRLTSRTETYLKIKDAFKIVIENKGDVDITIFGNYPLPSYSKEVFETGDTALGFVSDSAINYAAEAVGENLDILLTAYFKVI